MPQLVVRNIEDEVVRRLRIRAARHGHSMEEEHRRLLREVLLEVKMDEKSFSQMLLSIPKANKDEPEDLFARQSADLESVCVVGAELAFIPPSN